MSHEYPPEARLPLSGIQHFLFCRRQWALIHVERQWQENALTAEGRIMHQRVDDPFFTEKRPGLIIARAVPVASADLGLYGVCDVVEFVEADQGICLPGRDGTYQPRPVEYKRGKPKQDRCDEAQLCAQAMCLEEMLLVSISAASLYYGQTRHRTVVELTDDLRELVRQSAQEMQTYYQRGYTPRVKPFKGCRSCSLAEVCLPDLQTRRTPASAYLRQQIEEIVACEN